MLESRDWTEDHFHKDRTMKTDFQPATLSATFEYVELSDASKCPTVPERIREMLQPAPSPFEQYDRIAVWYAKNLRNADSMPVNLTHENSGTHVLVGCVAWRRDWQSLYGAMQGHNWSPRGEARRLIQRLGLDHTSMSVGDVLVCYNPDNTVEIWQCADTGWRAIDRRNTKV